MLVRENKEVIKSSLDKVIVTTANGKPIKPKTLGQKSYVNMIENNDVVLELDLQELEKLIWLLQWR